MINFAFHKIRDESNVEKKLERSWAGGGEGERQENLKQDRGSEDEKQGGLGDSIGSSTC